MVAQALSEETMKTLSHSQRMLGESCVPIAIAGRRRIGLGRLWVGVLCLFFVAALANPALCEEHPSPPTLAIGALAPDFCLPGIDDQTHCLKDYAQNKVFVAVFTCNHCPTAQLYESRIKQLAADYHDRGVALVAIEPNSPKAVLLGEMGYTDVGDSLEDMKIRAAYRHFNFPYLYDGETQNVSRAYGPTATPHVFVFDAARKLRYEGRVDNNPRESLVTAQDARNAIDAVLAGRPVPVAKTPSVGCSTKWLYKADMQKAEMNEIEAQPVDVTPAGVDDLKSLRKNSTDKLLLVNFWATWCAPCVDEFPKLETMYRMYGHRAFDLVTVSINYPDEKPAVLAALRKQHATSRNLIFGSTDIYSLIGAFGGEWNGAVPYTILISPNGEAIYQHQGTVDPLELKRTIIANIADDGYSGHQAYWKTPSEK
jgi:thiol-disulfide isomerase/thioredoxin